MTGSPLVVTQQLSTGYHAVEMSDDTLVSRVLEGDSRAFAMLIDRHASMCLRFATRMLGSVEDAEDVTQETLARAHRALARYDTRTAFRTWLMTILVNRCRTALVLRTRRQSRVIRSEEHVAMASVESHESRSALRDALERALRQLHPQQREAFLLKHVDELSYEEMSAVTSVGVSALKMRVQRACERLAVLLKEDRHD